MAADGRMVALVVEDDRIQSELGAAVLEEFNLVVKQVRSAEEAIDHLVLRSGHVAVVLADVVLPGPMDGLTLAHRVGILWPGISMILLSADTEDDGSDLPPGATRLRKPWRALDIVAAAERAVRADHSVHAVRLP